MSRIAFVLSLLALVLAIPTAYSQNSSAGHLSVLDVHSLDTTVDPCTDFFTYSCGGWLKKNPIPPDKTSWGVGSKLADDNRVLLREILEEAAAGGPGRDPVKQKIGDYYAACMDEKAIEAAGTTPLKAQSRAGLSGMRSKRDIARRLPRMPGRDVAVRLPVGPGLQELLPGHCGSRPGRTGPSRPRLLPQDGCEIRRTSTGLRGPCPEDVRTAGRCRRPSAATEAQTVLRIETALANGIADPGGAPRSQTALPQDDAQGAGGAQPILPLEGIFLRTGQPGLQSLNVTAPEFFKTMHTVSEERRPGQLEGLPALAPGACQCALSLVGFCERRFRFLRQDPFRRAGARAALEALRELCGQRSGRSPGPGLRGTRLPARGQAARAEMVKQIEACHGAGHRQPFLDVGGNKAAGSGEAAHRGQQDRLSRQMARLQRPDHRAR